ncbi:MAG: hypothetical protein H6Q48_2601 [Deltaproteobacteria bacterium]|nr:hypothetical protein [Deltaproteobacteria bacterium]
MGKDNVIFLEVIEWFDETGKELQRKPGRGVFLQRQSH